MTVKLYKALLEAARKLNAQVEAARLKLAAKCKHPEEFVSPYEHRRGNGYGSTETIVGKRCRICWCVDLWKNNQWSDPKDWARDPD